LVGAYQLLYSRIAPHAAISTAVEASRRLGKPWASKLVNGVLRRLQRDQDVLAAAVDRNEAIRYALPDWLYDAICAAWPEQRSAILPALQARPPMVLRVDLNQISRGEYLRQLVAMGIPARPHPSVATALVLEIPHAVERLPGFARGLVSVQDAGAQLAGAYLDPRPGQRVLDACAAPGGKTLDILQRAANLQVTAVDLDGERLRRVDENLRRAGHRAALHVGDAARPEDAEWGRQRYQRILLDVPCSATGVLRRHPDIRLLRRELDIAALVERQAAILAALWPLLLPGGRLLYVTCSLLPVENALQLDAFLQRHADAAVVELPAIPGIRSGGGVQLLPGIDDTDGFFYAALEKRVTV
jgi:16S rRNA (cytosine967-C5)-methyltransferase